ncbi:acyltransferase family protein [Geodermatophilus sp. SYSU D00710]
MRHDGQRTDDGRLRALDGLRFVAAAAVVAFHYTGRDNVSWAESVRQVFPTLSRFTLYGGFGPYLFFMISGFVVLMSAWGRPVPSFIASRVGRLFPAYWVAVVLTATVLLLDPRVLPEVWEQLGLSGVLANLSMTQQAFGIGSVDGVYWTLFVELKFYLLLVLLGLYGLTRERVLVLCIAWPIVGAFAAQARVDLLVTLLEPNYAPFFCIGILLYLVRRHGWSAVTGLLLGFNFVTALWVCSSYYIPWSASVAGASPSFRGLALLLSLCIAALALVTLTPVARLDWRWLTGLGALTYPLYLLHQNIGWVLLFNLAPRMSPYVALALVTALMLVLSHLVHRFVEQPLGGRLRRAVERDLGLALAERTPRSAGTRVRAAVTDAVTTSVPVPAGPDTVVTPRLRPQDVGPRPPVSPRRQAAAYGDARRNAGTRSAVRVG